MIKALCVIPEGRRTKYNKDRGCLYEVTTIDNLDELLAYSRRYNLGVTYLSCSDGLLYSDDIIEYKRVSLSKYSKNDLDKWSMIVSEQIFRMCLSYSVDTVYFMSIRLYPYKSLINALKLRGIRVELPILGCRSDTVRKRLSI